MVLDGLLKGGIDRGFLAEPARWLHAWRDGLLECLPESLRVRLLPEEERLALYLAGAQAEARLEKGQESQQLGLVERLDGAGIRRLLGRSQRGDAALVVVAPADDVLTHRFSLPSQVRDNLPRVLSYEIDRLTPFTADELYFDYRLVPTGNRERLDIELAFIKRDAMTEWLEALQGAAASPRTLTWPGAWPEANLLPSSARSKQGQAGRWVGRALWTLVLLLALAVLLTPLVQKREIVRELMRHNAKARSQAEQVAGLRKTLDNELHSANYVLDQKRSAPYLVELLRRLTELIPDSTWVSQLDYKRGNVQIRGESNQATTLIELLAAEPAFHNIAFRSPVVGVPNTDRERYHITFDYVPPKEGK